MAADFQASPVAPSTTRKSTETWPGAGIQFAGRPTDACEAYIKSHASQGWRALPQHYDDPVLFGGNLDRPRAEEAAGGYRAGRIEVWLVLQDRPPHPLAADFAKLVEAFDAKSISFVAVTQQFNTTDVHGTADPHRTLLVLCPVRTGTVLRAGAGQKSRQSRRKGKWTGGTAALGYDDARGQKARHQQTEAETVRIHLPPLTQPLELRSFSKLVRGSRPQAASSPSAATPRVTKFNGAIPFTYGPSPTS